MPKLYPALRYADGPGAIAFLTEAFGFTVHSRHDNEDGTVGHAELAIGDDLVMLGSTRDGGPAGAPAGDASTAPFSLYVAVEDVDGHYTRARAAGAAITREITEMDYGSREYSATDPEGYVWSFGTYAP